MLRRPTPRAPDTPPAAVLFKRDGTLIEDVPYNADPARVRPVAGARGALDRLRGHGVLVGVLTTQAGISRGILTREQVDGVHVRIAELLGPVDVWQICAHAPADGCHCRAPAPGLVLAAVRRLRVPPHRCVVIGDSAADAAAARAAHATGVLVPTVRTTRPNDIADAAVVATDLSAAVDWVLGGARAFAGAG
jgi:histidinol-phosphate phosphatase family protein